MRLTDRQSRAPTLISRLEDPFAGVDFSQLERSLRRPRTLIDFLLTGARLGDDAVSLVPLLSVVLMLLWRGGRQAEPGRCSRELPPAPARAGRRLRQRHRRHR
mgnify:CR=1 FL=1